MQDLLTLIFTIKASILFSTQESAAEWAEFCSADLKHFKYQLLQKY